MNSFSTSSVCPSMTSSFTSPSSPIDSDADRRNSITMIDSSFMMESARPIPWGIADTGTVLPFPFSDLNLEDGSLLWPGQQLKQPERIVSFALIDQSKFVEQGAHVPFDQSLMAGAAVDSSLSRPIFQPEQFEPVVADHMHRWRPSMMATPPRTVAPSATFQCVLPSSPAYRVKAETPGRSQYMDCMTGSSFSDGLMSSPAYSPSKSSTLKETIIFDEPQPSLVRTGRGSRAKGVGKQSRRTAEKTKAVRGYIPVIEVNSHPCTCRDKNDRIKRFKRQEHLKRHQKTCHGGERPHFCHVPGCKTMPFSRKDNLNSHLVKTHGRKSPASRNRYIATLDPKAPVFDREFRGPWTEQGWPIRN
jgi:hypothetical protein